MTEEEKSALLSSVEYDFLREDVNLKDKILLLTFGGSHSYGTNIPTSDIDLRGVAATSEKQLFGLEKDFEQVNVQDKIKDVDTCIYSFQKAVKLFLENNPNTIEMLGCRPEDYFIVSESGQALLDVKDAFLSKLAITKFGGYSRQRMDNIQALILTGSGKDDVKLKLFENSLRKSIESFNIVHHADTVNLTVGETLFNGEMVPSISGSFSNYPAPLMKGILSSINNVSSNYTNIHKRNRKKNEEGLAKQMMNLCRLLIMGEKLNSKGILETYIGGTYHDVCMRMRAGDYLTDNGTKATSDFYDVLDELLKAYEYAILHTVLPDQPDYDKINHMMHGVYKNVLYDKTM